MIHKFPALQHSPRTENVFQSDLDINILRIKVWKRKIMPLLAFKIIWIALNFNAALLIDFLINSLVSQRSKFGNKKKVTQVIDREM